MAQKFIEKIQNLQNPYPHQQESTDISTIMDPEDRENERIVREIKERKDLTEKRNKALSKIRDTEKLAMLSRYNEIHHISQIETVRLPEIYQKKQAPDRDDDSYGLL